MTIQYAYSLLIGGIFALTTIFTGSDVIAEQTDRDTLPPENMDTMLIKKLVKEKVVAMVHEQVEKVDSIKNTIVDSVNEINRSLPSVKIKHWKRFVDIEPRPNGHVYRWTWWYWIQKKGNYRDTIWDKMQVEKIR